MPELPPPPDRHGRHGRHEGPRPPHWRRHLLVSWLLGFLWLFGTMAGFVIGFGLAGLEPADKPPVPLDRAQQPGFGAALVGMSVAIFVLIIGAQVSIRRDRRDHPKARYRGLHWRYLAAVQAFRHNWRVSLICVGLAAGGLVVRHIYG